MRGYIVHEDRRFEILDELLDQAGDDTRHTLFDYEKFDYVILGLKGPDEQLRYQENGQTHRFSSDFFSKLKRGCHLYTFVNNRFLEKTAERYGLCYQSFDKNERVINGNADLTSEAVLAYLITHREYQLKNAEITIFGYGHLAKSLIRYLHPLTKNINVVLRNRKYDHEIKAIGKACPFESRSKYTDADIFINTIPARIIDKDLLSMIKNNAMIVDISSFPYGFDLNEAQMLGLNAVILPGLPGKYAYRDAAQLLFHAVMEGNACLRI